MDTHIAQLQSENDALRARIEIFRQAKLELDELEGAIDRQTYDDHRRADFDMPDDAELQIVLTAKDERRLSRALSAMTRALMENHTPNMDDRTDGQTNGGLS
jgi:hypothetical protein